jgi:oxygen-independent coproporphyrinogen-3 oxidase
VEALGEEILARGGGEPADTVYFGGGTPTMLSPRGISRILGALRTGFNISPDAEITIEANPDTVSPETLRGYRDAGVNRISFGVQSLHDHLLAELGRIHSADRARQAVQEARDAGFDNLSVDLMFGLPSQSVSEWREDLREALSLGITHLSAYELTLEKGTPLGDNPPPVPGEDEAVAMWEAVADEASRAGFIRYEVSNYARPGRECRHNLKYWRDEDFYGFGAGAWSSLAGVRTGNTRSIDGYLAGDGTNPAETDQPDTRKKMAETLMLALRTVEGCREADFLARYGEHALEGFRAAVDPHISGGRLERADGRLRLTPRGFMLANEIWADILAS